MHSVLMLTLAGFLIAAASLLITHDHSKRRIEPAAGDVRFDETNGNAFGHTDGAVFAAGARTYDLEHPDMVVKLPKDLKEISGLAVLDEQHLGAIQDEKGHLYILNVATGEVEREDRFAGDGDYEGIEWTPQGLYILRSDGTLYHIKDWKADDLDAKRIKTPLSSKYDTEGLAFDAANNRLLIACKEYAGPGLDDKKAIYAFDLATQTLGESPEVVIDLEAVRAGEPSPVNRAIRDILAPLTDVSGFKPSALAINPINGYLYVVSSVFKCIVVMTRGGELIAVVPLSKSLFKQPEGIAFMANGDLFISNEGGGGHGTLLRFNSR